MLRRLTEAEKRAREWVEAFVERLNQVPLYALLLQEQAHAMEPKRYASPREGTPIPEEKRDPGARDLAQVVSILRGLIEALERGDEAEVQRALKPAQGYLDQLLVQPGLTLEDGRLRVVYEDKTEGSEFFATVMLLDILYYIQHYGNDIKLGICHQCERVYVKRKHGAQSIYCSKSCKQKAYRARKKMEEVSMNEAKGKGEVQREERKR